MTTPSPKRRRARRLSFGRTRRERSGRWSAAYLHRGTLHRAPATFAAKMDATAWLAAERRLIDLGTWSAPADRAAKAAAAAVTLGDYAARWLAQRTLARRTIETYEYHLRSNILPALGDMQLADITAEDVREWFSGLDTRYRTRNARAYTVASAVFRAAVDDGLLERSPARIRGAGAVKHAKHAVVLLEADELAALADKMPAQLQLAVLLAGWCGLRRGEVFALSRADIGPGAATVRVERAVTYRMGRWVCGPTKTRESRRTVTVPTHIRPAIAEHLGAHVGAAKTALLFADPATGSFLPESRFSRAFFAARAAIGHDDLHFHDLRHFGGVMAALAGATTREIMDRLGHTSVTTSLRYQHVAAGRADALAQRLSLLATRPAEIPPKT
ncbi:MAG TPA: site-specific integrase [Mycobacterium sp.]|nr:site-specific integrase [Mycobacterium sp.]